VDEGDRVPNLAVRGAIGRQTADAEFGAQSADADHTASCGVPAPKHRLRELAAAGRE
jgi:hypothetical protein